MIICTIGAFAITFFNTLLLALIFRKRNFNQITNSYFQWTIFVTLWSLGYGITLSGVLGYDATLLWNRFCQAMAMLIGPYFFKLAVRLAGEYDAYRRVFRAYQIFGILNAILLLCTSWYVKGLWSFSDFKYQPLGGPLYLVFTLMFFWCNLHAYIIVLRKYLNSDGLKKKHLKLFLISTGIGYGISGQLFLQGFQIAMTPYAIFFMFIYVVILGYSIHRYKFLDIPVLIRKTIVFAGISFAVFALFTSTSFLITELLQKQFSGPVRLWLFALVGMIVTAIIKPLDALLVHVTDKYLFQKKLDYKKVLKTASEGLANINSLNHQMRLIVHFLTMRARIKHAAIYMSGNGAHDLVLKSSRPVSAFKYPEKISIDSPMLLYLKSEKKKPYLEYVSVSDSIRKYAKTAMYYHSLSRMNEEMKSLQAQLVVPSFYQGELQGILVLGEKKSEEAYGEEDIQVFQTIAQESAIAFENARKHDELVEQGKKLEHINEELRRTQAEVIQMKEEAAVSALSGGISHEVKNSVYGLTSGADTVEESLKAITRSLTAWYRSNDRVPDYGKRELFENIEEALTSIVQVKQASQHIDDVAHTLSQITKGKHAEMGRISIRMFLKNMVSIGMLRTYGDRVRTQALEKPPEVDAPAQLPSVRGHTELLKAVFINLFKNAIYAMDGISPKKIKIRALVDPEDSGMMRIEFSDNGRGIPPDVLPKIFDFGFTTKGAQGDGKGLYNVKTIIEDQHQGKIEVRSEVGKGTTFTIKIPVWKEPEEER